VSETRTTPTPDTSADDAAKRRLRTRNYAVAGCLVALFVIFYLITLSKGPPVFLNRPM
jgi:hypothetical protein